ncbi:MAG: hypothetical protein ABI354_01775 [Candidatus Saccharimonadales bacterium]
MYTAPQQVEFGYFYDALSGWLLPPSDPRGRAHTLARLMTATFWQGRVSEPHSPHEQRTFSPDWAPISSIVRVCNDDDVRTLTLTGTLGEGQDELRIDHAYAKGRRSVQVFAEGAETPVYQAALLGVRHKEIQDAVSTLAQSFFDQFPTAPCGASPHLDKT